MKNKLAIAVCFILAGSAFAAADETLLVRQPTVNDTDIVFAYANDLWTVPREGGMARRLTSHPGTETNPMFSPDGKWIAFTGQIDGNTDVYIVPAEGGSPIRLTYHPLPDQVRGWSADGSEVLFASMRASVFPRFTRLFSIPVAGGMAEALPMEMANRGSWSPDGSRLAYVRLPEPFAAWRNYRGGQQTEVWLLDADDYDMVKVPREVGNDTFPLWIGDMVYFISDRDGTFNLYSYAPGAEKVNKLTTHDDFDVKNLHASAGTDVIAYEQAGRIWLYDPATGTSQAVSIEVAADFPWKRAHVGRVDTMIRNAHISPNGKRVVMEARGDIYTVPAEHGSPRNLSGTPGTHDRDPAWSPDGKWIAWFSDEGGEYHLAIRDQLGEEPIKRIRFDNPTFYYTPAWSPDSKKILFTDKTFSIWYVDVDSGEATKVDTNPYAAPFVSMSQTWSPDSRWIAYVKFLDSHVRAVFLYSLETGESTQVTDGMSDATSVAFDASGTYLYFIAGTNQGPGVSWLDMSTVPFNPTSNIYAVVLKKGEPSPFLPRSDEEEVKEEKPENGDKPEAEKKAENGEDKKENGEAEEKKEPSIDLDGLLARTVSVPLPTANYSGIMPSTPGSFLYGVAGGGPGASLHRYDLKAREGTQLIARLFTASVSANGSHIYYSMGSGHFVVPGNRPGKPGDGRLNTAAMIGTIDPQAEWAQIYDEGWRINRDFFYDDNYHGVDWDAMYDKYKPFVAHVSHRNDLNYLLNMLIGELIVGHARNPGGDFPDFPTVNAGLLGADYEIADGHYRIANIVEGENWNPNLRSPLTEPGVDVHEGDYILAINGSTLTADMNIHNLLQGTANQTITLTVNDKPQMDGARSANVVPVGSEIFLRHRAWIEHNRQKVDEMSGGKLGYIYLPNTGGGGYSNFNRYYYAQLDKHGVIIDDRFNGGGLVADYIVDALSRKRLAWVADREGAPVPSPLATIPGPKVMLIDELSASGGDALPWMFREMELGTIVGKRTWGGLVGVYGYPVLIDGGTITAPRVGFYNQNSEWIVENRGVAPDVEVEQTPKLIAAGHDPQLEKAVEIALKQLEENPVKTAPRPEPIDRTNPPH